MDTDDKELFESATTDEGPEIVAETPETPAQQQDGPIRDDQGRFAPKAQTEPEPQSQATPEAQQGQAQQEANVPSWRLREEREAREAVERRFNDAQANWQRQFADMQARLPKPEPKPAPDVFENPNGFLEHGVRQAVDPIQERVQQITEYQSQRFAIGQHGAEKVQAAKQALANGINSHDPEAIAVWQRSMQSLDPYGDIMQWHQQRSVYQQIGNDPQAWFGKTLDERLAADPKFAGELMQKIQASARGVQNTPQGQPKIALPPSLRNVAASRASADDDGDMSDPALFAHALR